ncbi:MAG TPA: electron transport complex subunit RsxG [Gammaproteobacteria bacterium]|nr:electron transport complex subunit RsxG [Gammaproteobacteria bacterium]
MLRHYMTRSALVLGLFALVGGGLVAYIDQLTAPHIEEAERAYTLRSLHAVIDPALHDNDIFRDMITVHDPRLLGSDKPVPVFRARRDGKPVAVAIMSVAPDGYVGPIKLLVGIHADGTLAGVRVLSHKETPGLGDRIEDRRSDWILAFDGRSLGDPQRKGWRVQRDGGIFDQFTGATITPRAVVKAVYNTLTYYQRHKKRLFAQKSSVPPADSDDQ